MGAVFVLQVISALLSAVGLYFWFAENNVASYLSFLGLTKVQDTLSILSMAPFFFCLNATSFIPHKWRDVFRVVAAFFFLNNFDASACYTKRAFDMLTVNETIDAQRQMTPDAVRLTWASLILICGSAGISFVVAFLLEPILGFPSAKEISAESDNNYQKDDASKKKSTSKKPSRPSSPASTSSRDPLTYSSYDNKNSNNSTSAEHTLTITVASPLKLCYIAAAVIILAATATLISTGDACTHFTGAGSTSGENQLAITFPAIAFLLLTGSAFNDARALDIAVSVLMFYVVDWQPTVYDIHTEKKMLAVSALLQSAAELVILFVFLWGIVEARRRLKIGGFVHNLRSSGFRLACFCWILGFMGAGMILDHYTTKAQIWLAVFAGVVVPVFGVGAAVFGVESSFVPAALIGLRCASHLAANLTGTTGWVRSGWLLLMISNFGGCVSAVRVKGEPSSNDAIDAREHDDVPVHEEGVYEQIRSRGASAAGGIENNGAAAYAGPQNHQQQQRTVARKQNPAALRQLDADELMEWIKGDFRVFTGFLFALVGALSVRAADAPTYDNFLKAFYLAILVVVSLTGCGSASTVVLIIGASYVTSDSLWWIDNNTDLATSLATLVFALALWLFILFNREHFPYLPMHHAFSQDVEAANKKRDQKRKKRDERAAEREYLTNNNNNSNRDANANTGYGAC